MHEVDGLLRLVATSPAVDVDDEGHNEVAAIPVIGRIWDEPGVTEHGCHSRTILQMHICMRI